MNFGNGICKENASKKYFALLAHYGIRGIMHNTPYKGRSMRLEDAAMQAHQCLLADHGAFDSAYLYMNFNGGKLVRLFPEFVTLKEYSHQPGASGHANLRPACSMRPTPRAGSPLAPDHNSF